MTNNPKSIPTTNKTGDVLLDRWIRDKKSSESNTNVKTKDVGLKQKKVTFSIKSDIWNKHNVRFDRKSKRWYLKLSTLDVKEIRAKVWQRSLDKE